MRTRESEGRGRGLRWSCLRQGLTGRRCWVWRWLGGRRLLDWLSDGRVRQGPGHCDELGDLVWGAACVDDGVGTQDTSVSVEQEEWRAGQDGGVICVGSIHCE